MKFSKGCKRDGKVCSNCGQIHKDMVGKNNPMAKIDTRLKVWDNSKGHKYNGDLCSKCGKIHLKKTGKDNPMYRNGKNGKHLESTKQLIRDSSYHKSLKGIPKNLQHRLKIGLGNIRNKRPDLSERNKQKKGIKKGPDSKITKQKKRLSTIRRIERQKLNGEPLIPSIGKYETLILNNLEECFGYNIERQKRVSGYFLDGYCSILKLAIEVDEPRHEHLIKQDTRREEEIKKEIGCTFLRIKIPSGVMNY